MDASTTVLEESACISHDPHSPHILTTSSSSPPSTSTSSPSEYHSLVSSAKSSSSDVYLSPSFSPSSSSGSSTLSPKYSPTHPPLKPTLTPTPSSPTQQTSHLLSLLLPPLLKSQTRFLIHSGSAELFASEIALLVASLRAENIPVWNVVEEGLCHGGAQSFPMATTATKGKNGWSGKAARRAGRAFGAWLEGGGGREGGGEGWVWGD